MAFPHQLHIALDEFEKRTSKKIASGYNDLIEHVNNFLSHLLQSAIYNAENVENSLKLEVAEIKRGLLLDHTGTKHMIKDEIKDKIISKHDKKLKRKQIAVSHCNVSKGMEKPTLSPMALETEIESTDQYIGQDDSSTNQVCWEAEEDTKDKRYPIITEVESLLGQGSSAESKISLEKNKKKEKLHTITCDQCTMVYRHVDSFRKHVKSYHNKNGKGKVRKCQFCDKAFSLKNNFREHMRTVHNTSVKMISSIKLEQSKCDQCDFVANSVKLLRQHLRRKHLTTTLVQLECDQCGYFTNSRRNLLQHKRRKHHLAPKVSPKKALACDQCTYESKYIANLKRHIRRNHKEKAFACDQCTFESKYVANLKRHIRRNHKVNLEAQHDPKEFVVSQILDRRVTDEQTFYLVSWKGYSSEESTWEPRCNLEVDVPHLVKQVEDAQSSSTSPGQKYCVCGGIDNGSYMIHCDSCEEWFHSTCLEQNIENETSANVDWRCLKCKNVFGSNHSIETVIDSI